MDVCKLNAVVYKGNDAPKHIMLLLDNNHFDVLTSLAACYKRSYWCYTCMKGYDQCTAHRCSATCQSSYRSDCERDRDQKIYCGDCHQTFYEQTCYDTHKLESGVERLQQRQPTCGKKFIYVRCRCLVSPIKRGPDNLHICGESVCNHRHAPVLATEHKCFMKKHEILQTKRTTNMEAKFSFFDFKTYVNDQGGLVPNLAVNNLIIRLSCKLMYNNRLGRSRYVW